jgi:hypothetical protein
MFAYRMLLQFYRDRVFAPQTLTKIGTAYLIAMIFVVVVIPMPQMLAAVTCLQMLFHLIAPVVARLRSDSFKQSALRVIDEMVICMKTGQSFRHAFDEAKKSCDAFTQQKLAEVMSLVAFSQQKQIPAMSQFAKFLVEEFTQVDQRPHRAIQRLEVLRARLKMEREFRRRSGDATRQVQCQALVLLILYIVLFIAVIRHVHFSEYLPLFGSSIALMLAGYLLMWWLIRSFRWKV